MTLKEFLKGIADAIRKQKKSTQPIDAMDFATEIENLTTGNDLLVSVVDRTVTKIDKNDLDGATAIGDYAFYNCTSLTSVEIPDTVATIGVNAFYGCPIENVSMPMSALDDIPISQLKSVEITSGRELPENAFANLSTLTNVVIGDSVTTIGDYAFNSCSNLTSVTIGNSVTLIGEFVFSGDDGLESVYISDIEAWCNISFSGFYSNPLRYAKKVYVNNEPLTNLVVPDTVAEIKDYAFYGWKGLTEVEISNSVTSIGREAFGDCDILRGVKFGNAVTSIGMYAFEGCTSLTSVVIPDSVTSIGNYAFYECSSLKSAVIGDSVNSIGGSSFLGCSIEDATIPAIACSYISKNPLQQVEITSGSIIQESAFSDCITLKSVIMHNSITTISKKAFYNCSSLTSVSMGDSVTAIGEMAFQGCNGFTSIEIPKSVTAIGTYAFYKCSALTNIIYTGTTAQWNAIAFGSSWDLNTGNYTVICTDGTITK